MNDEKLAELREKYKNRNLREELSWGAYANHNGYTAKTNAEFLNWLCNAAYRRIKELEENEKWIPVKERLPENDGDYLLFGRIDESEEYYKFIGTFDAGAEEFGIWQECFDYNTLGCIGSEFYEYDEVLAWMPLPDDYKKGVEE